MPYEVKHVIHSQKKPARSHHEAILLDAIEKSIDFIAGTCEAPVMETVTVRLLIDNQLERVLCVTNDARIFPLLNNPDYRETKESLYLKFFEEEDGVINISDIAQSGGEYPLKQEFLKLNYKSRILIKTNHMGVVAVHSARDISDPENLRLVKARALEFRNLILQNIKQIWEGKLFGLYQELDILTSLAQRDEERAFHRILEFISRHHSIFRCALFMIHPDGKSYELLAGHPEGRHGTSRGWLADHPLLQNIVDTGKNVHIMDLKNDHRTHWLTRPGGVVEKYGITEIAGFPMIYDNQVRAVMTVDYAGSGFHFNPLIDQGFFQSVSSIISNILSIVSKIKRVRLDEDICRIVDHFLHEIRNPLTASAGFARKNKTLWDKHEELFARPEALSRLLAGSEGEEKKKEFLESGLRSMRNTKIIVREAERVEEILGEFETFVRLKHGNLNISRASVSLKGIGKYMEELFQRLVFFMTPELERREFSTDIFRLHQILFNLIKNAYEHTYKMDYKTLLLQSEDFFTKPIFFKVLRENGKIVFEVINEGAIPENIMGRIFEPYFTCGFHDGCGLGLPISSELARLMSGEITFENRVAEGKEAVAFRLSFPE